MSEPSSSVSCLSSIATFHTWWIHLSWLSRWPLAINDALPCGTELSSQDTEGGGRRITSSRLTLIIQQCLSLNKNAFSRSPRKRYNSRTCKGSPARNRLKKAVGPTLSVQWLRIIHKAGSHICLLNHVHLKRRTFPLILAISPLFIFFQLSAFLPPSLMCITKRNSHYSL